MAVYSGVKGEVGRQGGWWMERVVRISTHAGSQGEPVTTKINNTK